MGSQRVGHDWATFTQSWVLGLHWKLRVLTTGPPGKSWYCHSVLKFLFIYFWPQYSESWALCRRCKRHSVGKIPWRRAWHPSPVFSPGESHGQKILEGCSPRGCKCRTRLKPLACSAHLGSWFPRPGIGSTPLSVEAQILSHWTTREVACNSFVTGVAVSLILRSTTHILLWYWLFSTCLGVSIVC